MCFPLQWNPIFKFRYTSSLFICLHTRKISFLKITKHKHQSIALMWYGQRRNGKKANRKYHYASFLLVLPLVLTIAQQNSDFHLRTERHVLPIHPGPDGCEPQLQAFGSFARSHRFCGLSFHQGSSPFPSQPFLSTDHMLWPQTHPRALSPRKGRKSCCLPTGCQESDYRHNRSFGSMNACGSLLQTDETKLSSFWLGRFLSTQR